MTSNNTLAREIALRIASLLEEATFPNASSSTAMVSDEDIERLQDIEDNLMDYGGVELSLQDRIDLRVWKYRVAGSRYRNTGNTP